jgi:putative transposase
MSPTSFRVLWPDVGLEGTMKHGWSEAAFRGGRRVPALRTDELAAEGKNGEEVSAELGVSAATLYNWRRAYGGMDTDAAKELKELREQNGRLKRLLAEAELETDALREVAKGKL